MGQSTQDSHLTNSIMKMFVVLALAVLAAAEPEADPQLLVSGIHGVHTPYTHVAPVSTYTSPLLKTLVPAVKSIVPAVKTVVPAVKTVAATPVVSTYGSTYGVGYPMTYGVNTIIPAVKTVASTPIVSTYNTAYGVGYPLTYGAHAYGVIAAPKAVITNYQDSEHYTAEATPLGKALGEPSYVAKNGEVVHKVEKREAEADPALVYSGLTHTPYTGINTAVVNPIIYSGLTHTPFTGINSVYNTAAVNPVVYSGLTHTPFTGI